MKKIVFGSLGMTVVLLMFSLNIARAISGYGISKSSLHNEVLAQSNSNDGGGTTGGGTTGGGGGGTTGGDDSSNPVLWTRVDEDCEYKFSGKAGAEITAYILGMRITIKLNGEGKGSFTYTKGATRCLKLNNSNEQCEAKYCPPLGI